MYRGDRDESSRRRRRSVGDSVIPESKPTAVPISFGKPSLKLRLEAYYTAVAPDQTRAEDWRSRFDLIWDKYGGSGAGEAKLCQRLYKKYGTTVQFTTPAVMDAKQQQQTNEQVQRQKWQKESSHYDLTDAQRNSDCVDVTSEIFNPYAALENPDRFSATNSQHYTSATLMDRVEQCRSLLPVCDPFYRPSQQKHHTQRSDKNADSTTTITTTDSKTKKVPSCFMSIASCHQTGPLSVLYHALMHRKRIRIVIRYVNCIRGSICGLLLAYDKHMNIILRDAVETYTPRYTDDRSNDDDDDTTAARPVLCKGEIEYQRRYAALYSNNSNKFTNWTIKQRNLRQILIRGDSVVLLNCVTDEDATWPKKVQESGKKPIGTSGCLEASIQWNKEQRRHTNHLKHRKNNNMQRYVSGR